MQKFVRESLFVTSSIFNKYLRILSEIWNENNLHFGLARKLLFIRVK